MSEWWRAASIYQIYPASFQDSDGDGFGDLPGLLSRLDYVASLGVDAIWVSPFYKSPNHDMGYDISDWTSPDERYGRLEDVDAIIRRCDELKMKVLFDLVINHSSNEHRWFQEAKLSKSSTFRNYYIWRPPRYDSSDKRLAPTNWRAAFGGSTWEYIVCQGPDGSARSALMDRLADFHFFDPSQPDLNWSEPKVRQALYEDAILFWLRRGVAGFRVDTSSLYCKGAFVDTPIVDPYNYEQRGNNFADDKGDTLHEWLQEMNEQTFAKFDAFTLGEMFEPHTQEILRFVGRSQKKYNAAIRFGIVFIDHGAENFLQNKAVHLPDLKKLIADEQTLANPETDAWLSNYLENHDNARCVSRFGDDSPQYRELSAKMLAIFQVTLSGTLLLFQGQEIGVPNLPQDWPIEEYKDTMSQNFIAQTQTNVSNGDSSLSVEEAMRGVRKIARDHGRSPMHWSDAKQAGFSTADSTWMRVNDSYRSVNVAEQEARADSVLHFWRKMLHMRKQHQDTFVFGIFKLLDVNNPNTFCFIKTSLDDKSKIVVVLNWTGDEQQYARPDSVPEDAELLVCSYGDSSNEGRLRPWEGRVYAYAV